MRFITAFMEAVLDKVRSPTSIVFQTNGTTTALTLSTEQVATFAGAVSIPSALTTAQITNLNAQLVGNLSTAQISALASGAPLSLPSFTTTIGVGAATAANSGAGVTFPATQSASTDANTLDDYEEGSWTPAVGGDATYTSQTGHYTKVGRFIHIYGQCTINVLGTGSTQFLNGLPFANGGGSWAGSVVYFASLATNVLNLVSTIEGSQRIAFNNIGAAGDTMGYQTAIFGNAAAVYTTITYTS